MKSSKKSNAFVGYVWTKLRKDAQYQSKHVKDETAYLEYFLFILLEFDANNIPRKGQIGRYFYDGLKLLIKLWIADIGDEISWDNLINVANKITIRDKIQESTHLDQQCFKRKQLLKISLNSRDH